MIEPYLTRARGWYHQFAVEPQRRGDGSRGVRKNLQAHIVARHLPDDDECYCHFLYDSEPFSIASLPGAKETVLVAGRSRRPMP
jgi:hypothetical protein